MKIKYFLIAVVLAIAVFGYWTPIVRAAQDMNCMEVVGGSNYSAEERIACLQNAIATLMAQIQALQAQQGAMPAWCHTFNTNLRVGDDATKGNGEVASLQKALIAEGLFETKMSNDGYFDEDTASAVVAFQEKYASSILTPNRLTHGTGYVGPSTRAKLNSLYGCGTTPTPIPTPTPITCTPNWQCGWGTCVNGYQSQVATDSNNCGSSSLNTGIACPALARVCNLTNLTPTPTPQATITVTSPNGGETLQIGQTYDIKWNALSYSLSTPVELRLFSNMVGTGGGETTIAQTTNTGDYKWTVPSDIRNSGYPLLKWWGNEPYSLSGNQYKIVAYINGGGVGNYDNSGNYFIIGQNYYPPITVGLPQMDVCIWGGACNITWQATGITGNVSIVLDGFATGGDNPYTIATVPVSFGSYSWTVPSGGYIPAVNGKYKIKICGTTAIGTTVCGESDYLAIWQQAQ